MSDIKYTTPAITHSAGNTLIQGAMDFTLNNQPCRLPLYSLSKQRPYLALIQFHLECGYYSFDNLHDDHQRNLVGTYIKGLTPFQRAEVINEGTYEALHQNTLTALEGNLTTEELGESVLRNIVKYCSKQIREDYDDIARTFTEE